MPEAAILVVADERTRYRAEVDNLVLDERLTEAADLLAQHIRPEPAYSAVPGPRELAYA